MGEPTARPAPLLVFFAGGLTMRRGGRHVGPDVLGSGQVALVAVCLVAWHDDPVRPARLCDQLWGAGPPKKWRVSIRVAVSRLRSILRDLATDGDPIPFIAGAYHLAVTPVEIDVVEAAADASRAAASLGQGRVDEARGLAAAARAVLSRPVLPGIDAPLADELRRRAASAHIEALHVAAECRRATGEFSAAVSVARHAVDLDPLRESSWRDLMRAYASAGETAAALRAYDECRRRLADDVGVDPSTRTRRLHEHLVRGGVDSTGRETGEPVPWTAPAVSARQRMPYRGLLAFGTADADLFFGRDVQVQELLSRLERFGVVAVTGPSGSGKTSLVRAGLLPALSTGALPDSDLWRAVVMIPGPAPSASLLHALARTGGTHTAAGRLTPQAVEDAVLLLLEAGRGDGVGRIVLVVDQAEELFLATDAVEREVFFDAVLMGRRRLGDRLLVVLVLRSDFLDRAAEVPMLADLLSTSQYVVPSMGAGQLEAAIVEPAGRVGVAIESGLVGEVLSEVIGRPGALPLLQYAMLEVWRRREDELLTLGAYRAIGGVDGALRSRADAIVDDLDADDRDELRRLLLHLVETDTGAIDVRRRVSRVDLVEGFPSGGRFEDLFRRLVGARLLTVAGDPLTDKPTVEIAHEALLREWPRMQGWIEDRRDALVSRRRTQRAASEWIESGRDHNYLLRGTRLEQAEHGMAGAGLGTSPTEREFLDVSRRREQADMQARRRRLAATHARQLTLEATAALERDPERAIIFALGAVERHRRADGRALPEAIGLLEQSSQRTRVVHRLDAGRRLATASPDGRLVAVDEALASPDPVVFDLETGSKRVLAGPDEFRPWGASPGIWDLAFSPDGRLLAAGYQHRVERHGGGMVPSPATSSPPAVVLFDPETGKERRRLTGTAGCYHSLDFDPTGRWLAGAGLRRGVTVWQTDTGAEVADIDLDGHAGQVHFLPGTDGHLVIASQRPDGLAIVSRSGAPIDFLPTDSLGYCNVSMSADGHRVALTSLLGRALVVYQLDPWQRVFEFRVTGPLASAWSPDGTEVAVSGNRGVITLLDAATGRPRLHLPGSTSVRNLEYLPDGRLLSPTWDGQTLVWDVSPTGPAPLGAMQTTTGPIDALACAGQPPRIAVHTRPPGALEILDPGGARSRPPIRLANGADGGTVETQLLVANDQLTRVASRDPDGQTRVRTVPGLEVVANLPKASQPVALSANGDLAHVNRFASHIDPDTPNEPVGHVVDLRRGTIVMDLHRHAFHSCFLPSAEPTPRHLAISDLDHGIYIYELATGARIAALTRQDLAILTYPLYLDCDHRGKYLAGGTQDGRVWVADLPRLLAGDDLDRSVVFNRVAHTGPAPRPAVHHDGMLATVGHDSAVRLWNLLDGALVAEFATTLADQTPVAAFTPDGAELLYPDVGNVIRRHLIDVDELVRRARHLLTRNPTPQELDRLNQHQPPMHDH